MGEAHQVTINSGETPSEAPDASEVKTTALSQHGVSIPTDQDAAETSEESYESDSRPDWLPEKFESPEAMADAYSALESKLGTPESEPETEAEVGVSDEALDPSDLQPFYDEFAESGNLAEASFTSLESMGLERGLVQAFMEGQVAKHQQELNTIYNTVGGQEAYAAALSWATESLAPEEITAFNEQVETGDQATALMAVQGLMARFHQSGVSGANQPTLLQSEPVGPGGPAPYESVAQLMKDMHSEDYKTDSAYREKVKQKLARSNIM